MVQLTNGLGGIIVPKNREEKEFFFFFLIGSVRLDLREPIG